MPIVTFKIESLENKSMTRLDSGLPENTQKQTLKDGNIDERYDLQACMINQFQDIFSALCKDYCFIEEEHWLGNSRKRIDILAIDSKGRPVIMELKRSVDEHIMSQVMGYAGMMKEYGTGEDFLDYLQDATQVQQLKEFLSERNVPLADLNKSRSIIAVDDDFDIKTLGVVNWLQELLPTENIQDHLIKMLKVDLYTDDNDAKYFTFEFIQIPPPHITPRNTKQTREEVIANINNPAIKKWLQEHINSDWYKDNDVVYFTSDRARACKCWISSEHIRFEVLENHRTEGDVEYWRQKFPDVEIPNTDVNASLQFDLNSDQHFQTLEECLQEQEWHIKAPILSKEEKIETLENPALKEFALKHLDGDWYLHQKEYRINWKRTGATKTTWKGYISHKGMRVVQDGSQRFEGDVEYWNQNLSDGDVTEVVKGLSFRLDTAEDFQAFEAGMKATHTWL